MSTLHGLVDKGVKVELGIPYEMWDEPSAAVTKMKQYVSWSAHNLCDYVDRTTTECLFHALVICHYDVCISQLFGFPS